MRYKVGDKVKIRKDLIIGAYGNYFVNFNMSELAGKTFEVIEVSKEAYRLNIETKFGLISFGWTDEMLEDTSNEFDLKIDEAYFYITEFGNVMPKIFQNDDIDKIHIKNNNVFSDMDDAYTAKNMIYILLKTMKELKNNE